MRVRNRPRLPLRPALTKRRPSSLLLAPLPPQVRLLPVPLPPQVPPLLVRPLPELPPLVLLQLLQLPQPLQPLLQLRLPLLRPPRLLHLQQRHERAICERVTTIIKGRDSSVRFVYHDANDDVRVIERLSKLFVSKSIEGRNTGVRPYSFTITKTS